MSTKMSQIYEKAWHDLFYKRPRGIQREIIDNPHGRTANGHAHDVVKLAESRAYDREEKKKTHKNLVTGDAPF